MEYENKTNEELIDLLEGRDDEIDELKQKNDETSMELSDSYDQLSELHEIEDFDKETFANNAFDAGYEAKGNNEAKLKSWLNYKIGARI